MKDNFDKCLKIILEREGGYVYHPRDPGSHTNMGITIFTLSSYRQKECTPEDVKNLTVEEAGEIYKENYWNPLACDDLPSGVDLSVFDMGINAGVVRGGKLLQEVVGSSQDGVIGPQTLNAVESYIVKYGVEKLLDAYRDARMAFYRSLSTYDVFGGGWKNRADIVYVESIGMV